MTNIQKIPPFTKGEQVFLYLLGKKRLGEIAKTTPEKVYVKLEGSKWVMPVKNLELLSTAN